MIEIINHVSLKGWTMKFVPHPYMITVDFFVVLSGIEFRETLQCTDRGISMVEFEEQLWKSIKRMESFINIKLNKANA